MEQKGDFSLALCKDFSDTQKKQKLIWGEFFEKYSKEELDDDTYFFNQIPDDIDQIEAVCNYSNRVCAENASPHEKKVVEFIENNLRSNLQELILKREKTKILIDCKSYIPIDEVTRNEIRRLRKHVSREDVDEYIDLIVAPNEQVKRFIEEDVKSQLRTFLINQYNFIAKDDDDDTLKLWNSRVAMEFHYLATILPEQDVVNYCVNVLTKRF